MQFMNYFEMCFMGHKILEQCFWKTKLSLSSVVRNRINHKFFFANFLGIDFTDPSTSSFKTGIPMSHHLQNPGSEQEGGHEGHPIIFRYFI